MNSLNLKSCLIFLLFAWFGPGLGVRQYITLYTEQNQQGRNLTLDTNYANLSEHKTFLSNVSSYCAVGWVVFYTNVEYNIEGGVAFLIDNDDHAPKCQNRIFSNYNSMRFLGNYDTDVTGISLYSKPNYHGREVYVNENGTVIGELNFPVHSIASTGWANFTLFEGAHFNGTARCHRSVRKVSLIKEVEASLTNIGSVGVGCSQQNRTMV